MRSLTKFLLLLTFYSCGNSQVDRQYQSLKDENPDSLWAVHGTLDSAMGIPKDGLAILDSGKSSAGENTEIEPCDRGMSYSHGKLQLIPIPKDSGFYYFGQCNSFIDYDIIWIDCSRESKKYLARDSRIEDVSNKLNELSSKNGALFVPGFKTIYFQLPLAEVDDELTGDPYTIFPCDVNIGIGTSREDFKIVERKKGVKDFIEYNLLRYKWSLIIEKECEATD